jgi:homoserine O-acetyltransferase
MINVPGVADLGSLRLRHGGELNPCCMAYRCMGVENKPAVLVLGGISAGRNVSSDDGSGWWQSFVGPGKPVDTERFRVIGVDYLGSHGDSTGLEALDGSIDTLDQAVAIRKVLESAGIEGLYAIIGSSYGGMIALQFAVVYAELIDRLVVISAAHRPHPMATALRSAQRRVVRMMAHSDSEPEAMAIARAIAMTTYRSPQEFSERFETEPYRVENRFRFPVEDYLAHVGKSFAETATPQTFLPLSESIDLHHLDPQDVVTPATLISVKDDTLVPFWLMNELHQGLGSSSTLHNITSVYGHDAFLKEPDKIGSIVANVLGDDHG